MYIHVMISSGYFTIAIMEDDKLLRLHKRKEKNKLTFYKSFLKSFPFFSAAEAKEKET